MTDLRTDLTEAAGSHGTGADLDRIRQRGRQLRRRQAVGTTTAIGAVVAVAALLVGTQLDDDGSTVITDQPSPTTTAPEAIDGLPSVPNDPAPTTTAPERPPETAPSATNAPADSRQRVLEDPAGDAGGEQGAGEPDPSLDLLALDVAYDGDAVTFVHVVDGEPTTDPPEGATGRRHDTYFRIPGHNLVQVSVQTMERDLVVLVGVIEPGDDFGKRPAQRCTTCEVAFDAAAHELRVRVPVGFLNAVLAPSDGGEIRSGVQVGGWEAYTATTTGTRTYYEERESPHYFTSTPMDSAKRYDVFWTVP